MTFCMWLSESLEKSKWLDIWMINVQCLSFSEAKRGREFLWSYFVFAGCWFNVCFNSKFNHFRMHLVVSLRTFDPLHSFSLKLLCSFFPHTSDSLFRPSPSYLHIFGTQGFSLLCHCLQFLWFYHLYHEYYINIPMSSIHRTWG